jgi:hypothetical protein
MTDIRRDVRDAEIRAAREARLVDDTRIQQKVQAATREAFVVKFPGQLQHSMRLVHERLINCLHKPQGMDLARPNTWPATTTEIQQLAQALRDLNEIRQDWPADSE